MQHITPFLWYTKNNAEEAMNFYISIFSGRKGSAQEGKSSRIVDIKRYGEEIPGMKGKILTAVFELDGQQFMALDGGPMFKFTEAISLVVNCQDQEEVDYFWEKLIADGGREEKCGWLKDKFGLSWQIIPKRLMELMSNADAKKTGQVMIELLKMNKIEVERLEKAYVENRISR
jgi:predicted 3-demethylubiquinone-9 3-methyltransferase (glyoxalase superfamily)